MFDWKSPHEWRRLWRYYQAGIVNTLFGYGLFAGLIRLGVNMYLAQVISHVLGMAFNYVTYSRYAFAGQCAARLRFVLSYGANYLISVAFLALASLVTSSAYLAGIVSIVAVSAINYLILRDFVFRDRRA